MEYKGPEWTIDPDANYDLAGQVQALPDFNIESESEDEIASALDAFLAKMNSPYKLMINNLPKNLSKSDLDNFVQKDLNIPSAEINYSPGQPFCYIQFPNLDSCAEAMNIEGESFQGKTLQLKISPSDQGQVVRKFNMQSKNSGGQINKNRFSQLKQERRGGMQQQQNRRRTIPENKKHNFPVGGTIRKNRKKNTPKNSMPKTSAWATSGGREQPRSQQSRREPRRGDPTYGDNRNSGRRGGDVRDNQRQSRFSRNDNNNRRDDQGGRDNFSRGDNRRDDQGGRDNNRMNSRRDYGGRDVQNNRFGRTDRNDRNERNERSGNDRNERSFNDRNERSDRWGNDGPRDVQRGNSGRRDRDPENDNNWRNMGNRMDNHGNEKLTIKRRQNRAPVTKDQDGFSTSTRAKPVKSIVRENSMNSKKKIAEEKETKQKTRNAFDLLMDEE